MENPPYTLFSIVLYMQHIGMNYIQAEMRNHFTEFLYALFIGCNLGFKVSYIMANISGGIWCGSEEFYCFFFHKATARDE